MLAVAHGGGAMINPSSVLDRGDDLLYYALRYAEIGLSVLPVSPAVDNNGRADKRPLTRHGVDDATRDPALIQNWWDVQFPRAMIGIALGKVSNGWIVVDIDNKAGGVDGFETIDRLRREGFALPPSEACVWTPGNGLHIWYRVDSAIALPAKKLPGVDILSDRKYVIAPPSRFVDGRAYQFVSYAGPAQ